MREIRAFARHFCAMALGSEPDADLKLAFHDLRELKVDVAYPFLLELYHDYKATRCSKADLLASVRLVEAYVFRRAICAIPTNSMNKTFATFTQGAEEGPLPREHSGALSRRCRPIADSPTDDEFHRDLQTRDLYNFRSRSYWLRRWRITAARSACRWTSTPSSTSCRRTRTSRAKWREALGPEWQRVQQTWLHTLGNLTLTALQLRVQRPPVRREARHARCPGEGAEAKPAQTQSGARRAGDVERRRDQGPRWQAR